MTFDEAIEQINNYDIEPEYKVIMAMLVDGLRDTYAKPVKMTQWQRDQFMTFRDISPAWFGVFLFKQSEGDVPAFHDFITEEFEKDLMRAWLHPELIEVSEDA